MTTSTRPYARIALTAAKPLIVMRATLKFLEESSIEVRYDGRRYRITTDGTTVFVKITEHGSLICDACPQLGAYCIHEHAVDLVAFGRFHEPLASHDLEGC